MSLSQSDAGDLIRARKHFKAGNVYAETKNGCYVVYSYGEHFPLAIHVPDEGWSINTDRYSISTTCQQSKTGVRSLPEATFADTEALIRRLDYGTPESRDVRTLAKITTRFREGVPA